MIIAPYGTWPSPVTVDLLTSATIGLSAPTLDGDRLYWLESRPDQGGRASLWRRLGDGTIRELTPDPWYVRTRVHEYGGGEYHVSGGVVVFSHFGDGRVYRLEGDGDPVPLTPKGAYRYADLRVHPGRDLVLAVREDHTGPGEPINTIVALPLHGTEPSTGTVLCEGADFYSTPELGADDRLAWVQWDHPAMPWDATAVRVGRLEAQRLLEVTQLAGGPSESAVQPRWLPGGDLIYLSDRTGWWNLHRHDGQTSRPVRQQQAEFAQPQWTLGDSPYAILDGERLLCTGTDHGDPILGIVKLATGDSTTGELTPSAPAGTGTDSVTIGGGYAAAVLSSPDQPRRLSLLDLSSGKWATVRTASEVRLPDAAIARAEAVRWESKDGPVYGWYYPPTSADHTAPAGEAPPMITLSHGGPTGQSTSAFNLSMQYWTSRGFAILDVNYGGSTGYGRAYRERLRGRWGYVDVADCVAGAAAMVSSGLADPQRLVIRGGSAGGYTTLRALTTTTTYSAGISLYGVGELVALATDTHKFESRYLDSLIGPYPEAAEVYRERSPVHDVDAIAAPILLLQGADDRVVPPAQAEAMAAAARAKGLPVALIMFPGEGHGFRRAETIRAALEAQLDFLARVFGLTPADDVAHIDIDNL